jgi:hypothetical protein
MASFTVTHETPNGTNLPHINVTGGTIQMFCEFFTISADETAPAEQQALYNFVRTTDAGTGGSALTEVLVNPLSATVNGAAVGGTFTAAPTVSDVLWLEGVHQKIPFVYQAYPGREWVSPAVAGDGFEVESNASSSAFAAPVTIGWRE